MICTKATQGAASDTSPIAGQAYRYLHFLHRYCTGTERTRHQCKCPSHTKRLRIALMDLSLCASSVFLLNALAVGPPQTPAFLFSCQCFILRILIGSLITANRTVDATWMALLAKLSHLDYPLGLSRKAQSRMITSQSARNLLTSV